MSLAILNKRTIIDTPDNKGIEVRHGRHTMPSKGELSMRCGYCGSTDFTVHLKPLGLGAARVTTVVCSICSKKFPFNDQGITGGSLKIESTRGYKHREAINGRHDET
ncbi:MAG: hypothetical protein ACXABY_05345 [Candidatus Thorarchaeota archaeon]|jgi:DNA-directed RNA polymerase subunit RPC12/RpoP